MPRKPKPFFRKQTKSWYFSTGGKQIALGKDRDEAFRRFHEFMSGQQEIPREAFTLYDLSQSYLDWVEANRARSTYVHAKTYLRSFIEYVARRMKPTSLRSHQVNSWLSATALSSTSKAGAVGVVQRMLNWAVEHGNLRSNPIAGMKKPKRRRRDVVFTNEQWKLIRSKVSDTFGELLDFMYLTGCRPQEARTIERRHMHGDVVIFPAEESKGESPRVILLTPEARCRRR